MSYPQLKILTRFGFSDKYETKKFEVSISDLTKLPAYLYFLACFIFFAFFYNYHLLFIEQLQLFRFSWNHLNGYFKQPASISCLLGEFLTQFYYFKIGGSIIITTCLVLFWYQSRRALSVIFPLKPSIYISLLLTVVVTSLHFNILYPLAATISLIAAVVVFRLYNNIQPLSARIVCGIILIPVLYILTGLGIFLFLVLVLLYKLKKKRFKGFLNLGYSVLLLSTVVIFPSLMRFHYYLTLRQAYLFPVTELATPTPNFVLETMFSLDYEWYSNRPEEVIKLARKTELNSRYVTYYFNMASASMNKLPENLLSFNQYGLSSMYIPYNKETNFISLLFGNELYYLIADMNASQHFALMANTFSPKCESSRMIRRLVETNIVNGEYAVAAKYLKMLNQTLFYRNWADEMEQFLSNEELCGNIPWIEQKRALMPVTDHIDPNPNNFISTLLQQLNDHPGNKVALDYLLCIYLLHKDLNGFYEALVKYNYYHPEFNLPRLYQEALIVCSALKNDREVLNSFQVSAEIIQQSKQYEEKYFQAYGKKSALMKDFGNTYWFYLNFSSQP